MTPSPVVEEPVNLHSMTSKVRQILTARLDQFDDSLMRLYTAEDAARAHERLEHDPIFKARVDTLAADLMSLFASAIADEVIRSLPTSPQSVEAVAAWYGIARDGTEELFLRKSDAPAWFELQPLYYTNPSPLSDRARTLEEAAKVCEDEVQDKIPVNKWSDGYVAGTKACAKRIRALAKSQPAAQGDERNDTVAIKRRELLEIAELLDERWPSSAAWVRSHARSQLKGNSNV